MNTSFAAAVLSTQLAPGQVSVYYLGQNGCLFRSKDCTMLIDPYLSDYVDQHCNRDPALWSRLYPAPVSGEEVGFVDYVFCSHAHNDHRDPWTLSAIARSGKNTLFFASRAFAHTLQEFDIPPERIVPLDAGETYSYPGLSLTAIPAAHEELHPTDMGYAELSFRFTLDGVAFFHGGDCCMYPGLAESIGKVDMMLLPVNGRDYYRRRENIIGNLTAKEAVLLACECGADMLIPLHYDLYLGNGIPAADFVHAVLPSGLKYHLFRPGERMIYSK